jgi:hypothetical protein
MAISLRASGTWATVTTDTAITIPGGSTTGDMMFLFASWKDFSVTATVSDWTEITEFADGSVSSGNGTGSMKVACWYKEHDGSESDPTLEFSGSVIGGAVITTFQKGGGDTWDTPTFVTAALSITGGVRWSATSSSTLTVADGSVIIELVGIRDDSSTVTRHTTDPQSIADDGSPAVTWNGNYVESPASHQSTTTGNDMAADLGHRFVTTGAAGVSLTSSGTISNTETGAVLWVHEGLSAGTTVTPGTLSLTLTTFAPTVTATQHVTVTPGTATLTLTTFAPNVVASDHKVVTPTTASLTLTTFAPTINIGVNVIPATASLTLTAFAPTVTATAHVVVVPSTAALTLTTFAPNVVATDHKLVTPTTASLSTSLFAPTVTTSDHKVVTPGPLALTLSAFAPTVTTAGEDPVVGGFGPSIVAALNSRPAGVALTPMGSASASSARPSGSASSSTPSGSATTGKPS